ncbi:hypothetical protein GCM10008025_07290 [Ornithinibacillus halotolerans]|uniref:Uncharacterized protein n=1 Tax=Ornithinibacillus halotolerans TaxID=1274357 RepID=A0A916RTW8_9BACI|nr:hypothetical protein GCM10008025_07290 [Ornithinibacillus halotolerans]
MKADIIPTNQESVYSGSNTGMKLPIKLNVPEITSVMIALTLNPL